MPAPFDVCRAKPADTQRIAPGHDYAAPRTVDEHVRVCKVAAQADVVVHHARQHPGHQVGRVEQGQGGAVHLALAVGAWRQPGKTGVAIRTVAQQ